MDSGKKSNCDGKKQLALNHMILPMEKFCGLGMLIEQRLKDGNAIEDDYVAPFKSLEETVSFLEQFSAGLIERGKEHLVKKLLITYVRDGGKYGKLTGSTGAASYYFTNHPYERVYANMDCGSRATKLQLFLHEENTILSVGEYEIPGWFSFSELKIGNYIPKKQREFDEVKKTLIEGLSAAYKEFFPEIGHLNLGKIKCGVFITGF